MLLLRAFLLALTTLCSINAIPLAEFYPFGQTAGDTLNPTLDDGSSELITLNRVFPFYGIDNLVIVVNNNGLISFGQPQTRFTSLAFPLPDDDTQLIAPFWGDVDTSGTGNVWYRETTSQADRNRAQREIRAIFTEASSFTPRMVFIATWDHVGYYNNNNNTERTNTFQCILVSDGFMSYVIFLYADGLIQWTTGDASGGSNGFGGTQAQIGFNAGDMINFASHPFSQTSNIINIASSRVPENVARDGMLVYRVDGTVIPDCVEDESAKLVLSPRLGNQLGGTPVLIGGLCLEPTDFIQCGFDGRFNLGEYFDANTAICDTPIMTTTGEVEVILRRTRPRDRSRVTVESSFTNLSPIRAHHVAFVHESTTEDMQLYLNAHNTITLRWLPDELVPSYLTDDDISSIPVSIELYQQIPFSRRGQENWRAISDSSKDGLTNSGQASYTVPTKLVMMNCPDQNQLCPVAFRVSATVPIPLRGAQTQQQNLDVRIWSGVAFLQADGATEASLSQICEDWAAPPPPEEDLNRIPSSRLSQLPQCPPMLQQAQQDNRFLREVLRSALSSLDTGYEEAARKFFTPNADVCYIQIVNEGREGQQCCYGSNGRLVTGQPGGGSVDEVSPMMNFALHILNDLLPYAYCCRGGQRCNRYEDLRPSRQLLEAPPYELPVPDNTRHSLPSSGSILNQPGNITCEVTTFGRSPVIQWHLTANSTAVEVQEPTFPGVLAIAQRRIADYTAQSTLTLTELPPAFNASVLTCSADNKIISSFLFQFTGCPDETFTAPLRDGSTICSPCPRHSTNTELVINSRVGHQLGGTPVLIQGLCLEQVFVQCTFDGRSGEGRFVDKSTALCITPIMSTQGTVTVSLTSARRGMRPVTASGTFITVPSVRAYQVGFSKAGNDDEMQLYLKAKDTVKLTWLPDQVLPAFLSSDDDVRLNVQMFQQIDDFRFPTRTSDWVAVKKTLVRNIENTGSYDFEVPEGIAMENCLRQNVLCPVVFRVSVVRGTRVNVTGAGEVTLEGSSTPEAGIWSAVAYFQRDNASQANLSQLCEEWANPPVPDSSRNRIPESRLRLLPACPPTERLAALDPMFRQELMRSAFSRIIDSRYEENFMKFFTPSASRCYLQVAMEARASHHCCYGSNGALVTGQPAGGSVDAMSPMVDFNTHNLNDLLPYAICCQGGLRCDRYNDLRPSRYENEPAYELPIPAFAFGDPHIVTLDRHKYTFNGKGEFTLVETLDNSFTLQGRMEQPVDASNNTVPGTVFTVIVARQSLGGVNRTVEFQVNQDKGLDILVDGTTVDFSDLSEQDFQQVVVIDAGNDTGIAEFSGGSNIEIRVENGIISVMLVTLPIQYRGLTRGLMGNYNNKTLDDFIKKGSTAAMPLDSSNEEIFEFGNTWILVEPSESLFAYNREGESFGAFSDSSFTPAFEPEFENPELEQRAKAVCGDDQSCLFDIAATKNENIGMATMVSASDFEEIVDLAEPIVCVPECGEGVCVATNSCACAVGYTGERCTQKILSACEQEMCQNNGTCVQHVRSFTCTCPEGFIGIFCQEKEPPLSLKLINSSPRTFSNITSLDFIPSQPLDSASCILTSNTEVDCTLGSVRYRDLSPGYHNLLINATAITGEKTILTRTIFICAASSGSCGVNLINEGVSISGDCVLFQFTGCGPVQFYSCSIDNNIFKPCLSPLRYCGLTQGQHRLRVQPDGEDCDDIGGLTTQFDVI